jgi:hypothetical protein
VGVGGVIGGGGEEGRVEGEREGVNVSKSSDDKSGKGQGHGDHVRRVMANKEGERSWRQTIVRTTKLRLVMAI